MSLNILVNREVSQPNCMRSRWLVNGQPQCVGLELPAVPLVEGRLYAIPEGDYQVIYNQSLRFSARAGYPVWLPLILDLKGHTTLYHGRPIGECGIRIHGANVVNSIPVGQKGGPKPGAYDVKDPNRTDLDGCLGVGTIWGPDNKSLVHSQDALRPLIAKIAATQHANQPIFLTIRNAS